MTSELVLLLLITFSVLAVPIYGSLQSSFRQAVPNMAARIEKNMTTGDGFSKIVNTTSPGVPVWTP